MVMPALLSRHQHMAGFERGVVVLIICVMCVHLGPPTVLPAPMAIALSAFAPRTSVSSSSFHNGQS
ncbi:hypothetical protein J6590_077844 [Homalodisca vitripennis]|nr:hypothetical protein J6590_077844 [Homalodisca vitripennis]